MGIISRKKETIKIIFTYKCLNANKLSIYLTIISFKELESPKNKL